MINRPKAVAFDVIGTLFDISPLEERLTDLGLRPHALQLWFARVLRDACALEVSGEFRTFRQVASGTLRALLEEQGATANDEKIEEVLSAFAQLAAHEDVEPPFGCCTKRMCRPRCSRTAATTRHAR